MNTLLYRYLPIYQGYEAKDADIVLLGVKPQNVEAVLRPLSEEVDKLGPLKVTFFFFVTIYR